MPEPEILDPQQNGGFSDQGLATRPQGQVNTANSAAEAEVRAIVEARVLMAFKNPRNWFLVRGKLLEACKRPVFAESAMYRKPVGKKKDESSGNWVNNYAEGLSVRFAEEAVRCMGNTMSEEKIVFEDAEKRVIAFGLMDLEGNNTDMATVIVSKTVERSKLKEGQKAISQRTNSAGYVVYLVEATDDEVAVKAAAMIAKKRRDDVVRLCPSDIKEECIRQIKKTQMDRDRVNPQESLNRLLDAFQEKGIMPDQVQKYLGHELTIITPAEVMALRGIFGALQDGEITWVQLLKDVEEDREAAMSKAAGMAESRKGAKDAGKGAAEGSGNSAKPSAADSAKAAAGQAAKVMGSGTMDIPT